MGSKGGVEESKVPLLRDVGDHGDHQNQLVKADGFGDDYGEGQSLTRRVWIESKKLWKIVGPAIFSRITSYSMLVITQAFAGHLGDLELAAISIANNVIVGFDFGLLVSKQTLLHHSVVD